MEVSDYLWYILVRDWSNFSWVLILYVLLNISPNSSFFRSPSVLSESISQFGNRIG
jgi:hypothetical protein